MAGNQNVVVALFADEDAADGAKDALMKWDKANHDIKLGAIGTITKKGDKVKTHVGRRAGKGMWTGAVVGLIAAMFPPVALAGGVIGGAALGGLTGVFFKKPLNLNKEEVQQIADALDAGKTALVATCDDDEVGPTRAELTSLGGTVWTYGIPEETLQAAAAELPAALAEEPEAPVAQATATEPSATTIDEAAAPVAQEAAAEPPTTIDEPVAQEAAAESLAPTMNERIASVAEQATATVFAERVKDEPAAPVAQEAPSEAERTSGA